MLIAQERVGVLGHALVARVPPPRARVPSEAVRAVRKVPTGPPARPAAND
ncbi:hypothetical protein [Lapillicoccus sp.]|nr:hypothetical protein [Actinomycetota bacterium]